MEITREQFEKFEKWQRANPMPQDEAEKFDGQPLIYKDCADYRRYMIATGQIQPPPLSKPQQNTEKLFAVHDRVMADWYATHPQAEQEPSIYDLIGEELSKLQSKGV